MKEGIKRMGEKNRAVVGKFKEQMEKKDELLQALLDPEKEGNKLKIMNCEKEWGVKMTENEYRYLQDQRTERNMECDNGVDPIWYRAVMKRQRMRERQDQEYIRKREENFRGKTLQQIEDFLESTGEIPLSSSPNTSTDTPKKTPLPPVEEEVDMPKKRKRLYESGEESEDDDMPEKFRHVRSSERKVKEEVYQTYAALSGQGLSVDECSSALVMVANGMFGRSWTKAGEEKTFGNDTLPEKMRVIEALRQIEAQSLNLVVLDMKRGIAFQLRMGLEQLSICSGFPVKEQVDVLFSDSVDHNKGVNFILQEMFDLNKAPGQLFCGTHTCLGFSSCQNKMVTEVERKMKLETVLSQFMVGMELDSKSGSLAGQALDMQLKLVAPEYKHKSWNYHGLYTLYLEQRDVELSLFS